MCGLPSPEMIGYRRVTRTYMRLRRIHDYAANRFLEAESVAAACVWRGIMKACIYKRREWVHKSGIDA